MIKLVQRVVAFCALSAAAHALIVQFEANRK